MTTVKSPYRYEVLLAAGRVALRFRREVQRIGFVQLGDRLRVCCTCGCRFCVALRASPEGRRLHALAVNELLFRGLV